MDIRKIAILVLAITLGLQVTACGNAKGPSVAPTLSPTAVVVSQPTATGTVTLGSITGRVHLAAPPTPRMVVYALDPATGQWASTETAATDGEALFTLPVPPGSYQVFAAAANWSAVGAGYSLNGSSLTSVAVAAGQTVADIRVGPPGQSECGATLGFPASPDGRFAATAGPAPDCLATLTAAQPPATDAVRIQFPPNATRWYTPGDLAPNASIRFVLAASKGQHMTVRLTTEPATDAVPYAALYITGADGQVFTFDPATYWSNVLSSSQDYYIEVRSLAQAPILYTLSLEIPAAVIDPALGDKYDLVSRAVCETIQRLATQALGVDFALEARAPFLDTVAGEAGQGCRLTASGDGNKFTDPRAIVAELVRGTGFTEQMNYQADGPAGSATGATRDTALMLIKADWAPVMGVQCPSDRPISDCNLTPEQKIYTIQIDTALYRFGFSLDGHWEDAATGFSLDLYQAWKNIYGHHTMVAQGGDKIDTLDVSILGSLKGNVATVQFQSAFTRDLGTAQLTYIDPSTMSWKIIDPPEGEYYFPKEAMLIRK